MNVLAISGSLRSRSTNTELLLAARALAPADMLIDLYSALDRLPHFNPDVEPTTSDPVMDLKQRLHRADGLLISSPEYARGVPGSLKNALDWLVSGPEFVDKPVALLNASPRSTYGYEALRTTVATMSGRMVDEASITLPLLGMNYDAAAMITDVNIAGALRAALVIFRNAIADAHPADSAG